MSLHRDMLVGDLWVSDPLFLLRDCPDYYSDTPSEIITTGQGPLAVLCAHVVSGKIVEFFASSKRVGLLTMAEVISTIVGVSAMLPHSHHSLSLSLSLSPPLRLLLDLLASAFLVHVYIGGAGRSC